MHDDTIKTVVHKMDCNTDGVQQIIYQYFFYSSQVLLHKTVMNVTILAVRTCKFERLINLSGSLMSRSSKAGVGLQDLVQNYYINQVTS
jgi:hypothetical protein